MERLRTAFAALGQPTRMRIFETLLRSGDEGMMHGEIAAELDVPKALLTAHLTVLEAEALITVERRGKFKVLRVAPERVRELAAAMLASVGPSEATDDTI